VAVVQGNIEQDRKWEREYQDATLSRYEALTRKAVAAGAELVVWPETAAPFYFQEAGPQRRRLLEIGRRNGAFLLFGSPAYAGSGAAARLYNRAYLISPAGTVVGHYDKIRLAPFGEYVPFGRLLFFVDKLVEGIGDFAAGTEYKVLGIPQGRFGVLICYEDIFPDLTRRFVLGGADFLVNITNDAWFGRTSAPYQHLVMAAFRAVENRVPLVRATNTGVSAFIAIDGKIEKRTELFRPAVRVADLAWPAVGPTFYTRRGDVFARLSGLVAAIVLGYGWLRGRRGHDE
jgi:apolipoprotein N-acyltransferase